MGEITKLVYDANAPCGPLDIYISGRENAHTIDNVTLGVMAGSITNSAWRNSDWFKQSDHYRTEDSQNWLNVAHNAYVNTRMSYDLRLVETPRFYSVSAVRQVMGQTSRDIDNNTVLGWGGIEEDRKDFGILKDFASLFSRSNRNKPNYQITGLSVRREMQNRGVGAAMLYALLDKFYSLDEQPFAICPNANERGLKKLKSLGFIAVDTYVDKDFFRNDEPLVMTRLSAPDAVTPLTHLRKKYAWIEDGHYVSTELIPTEVRYPITKKRSASKNS